MMTGSFKIKPVYLVAIMGMIVVGSFLAQFFDATVLVLSSLALGVVGAFLSATYHFVAQYRELKHLNSKIKHENKRLQDALDIQIYEADALRHTLKEIGFEMHGALERDLTHMGDVIENILDTHLAEVGLQEMQAVNEDAVIDDENIAFLKEYRDPVGMQALDISDKELTQYLNAALEHKKVDVYAQPVVALPSRHVIGYELFSRIWVDGQGQVPAAAYIDLAQREEKMSALDNLLLIKAMLLTRKYQENSHCQALFINLSPLTLHDAQFMAEMVAFLTRYRVLAPNLVFEMPQSAYQHLTERQKKNIQALGKAGCRFSMDQVWDFEMDVHSFTSLHIAFVKTDAQDVVAEMASRKGFKAMQNFQEKLSAYDVSWVVEKIEDEKDLLDILDLDVGFGQGYLFDEPQPLKNMMEYLTKISARG